MLITIFLSCDTKEKEYTHREGELTIYADPTNESLLKSLTEIYNVKFPNVKFKIIYEPENVVIKNLLDTVASAGFINKPLTEEQSKFLFQKTNVHVTSTLLAYDAAVFITSKENPIDFINFEQIKSGILQGDSRIIFDNGNSGNVNCVKEVLKLKLVEGQKLIALTNSEEVIQFLEKSTSSIGVVGLNAISENAEPSIKNLMKNMKVLPVVDSNHELQDPSVSNILAFKYPFYKGVYFIVREAGFGIGSGFARFAGSEQGQLIVKREGLQPNYIYPRNIQVNKDNLN